VVGAGVEIPPGVIYAGRGFGFDISGTQIKYLANENIQYGDAADSGGTFNGFVLTFAGAPNITNVTLNGATNFAPVDFDWTSYSVTLNYNALHPFVDSVTVLDVTFAVPEPSIWIMMITGFGLVGFALRRQRNVRQGATA
jgi:hypothetical protein